MDTKACKRKSLLEDKAVNETMSGITPRFDDAMFTDSGRIHHEGSRKPPAAAVVCNWSPKVPPETWSGAPEWTKGYLRLQSWRTSMWPDSVPSKLATTCTRSCLSSVDLLAGHPVAVDSGVGCCPRHPAACCAPPHVLSVPHALAQISTLSFLHTRQQKERTHLRDSWHRLRLAVWAKPAAVDTLSYRPRQRS